MLLLLIPMYIVHVQIANFGESRVQLNHRYRTTRVTAVAMIWWDVHFYRNICKSKDMKLCRLKGHVELESLLEDQQISYLILEVKLFQMWPWLVNKRCRVGLYIQLKLIKYDVIICCVLFSFKC